ncbi:TolC family protein [Pedobacter cryophilus]|uniref:TolC family protein n=1 Tax=Pedobacter cryophilus TaxID=2571271 RepID=A0A4U1BVH3_9SPHI|nr:TolC family protein [Pedobacter cryophilus]TKB96197.1 TolC family protein [Pedobacter cryophilus]
MKSIKIMLLLIIGLFIADITFAQQSLSLKEALNYAIKNSENIKKAKLDIEGGKYATAEIKAQALPQINGTGTLTNNLILQQNPLPGELVGRPGETVLVAFGTKWNSAAQVQLSQQIFNQSVFTGLKAAKSGEDFYNLSAELTEESVIQQVASAYYQVLVYKENIAVLDSNINSLKSTQKIVSAQYQNGLAKKIDLDRVKVSLTNLLNQRAQVIDGVTQQENLLKFYMGMPISTAIDIPTINFKELNIDANKIADSLTLADLTEYKVLMKQKELLQFQKKANQAEYLPKLSFNSNFAYTGVSQKFDLYRRNNGTATWFDASSLGLTLNIPIFDGFARRSRVNKADVEIRKINEELTLTKQSLNLAYENAKIQIRNSVNTINSQEENKQLAQEIYNSTQNNYKNGLASLTDLLDAESSLTEAQNSYNQALLNYKLAEIQLIKSKGNIQNLLN